MADLHVMMDYDNTKLDPIVAWMRTKGVRRVVMGADALEIELGPPVPDPPAPKPPPTEAEVAALRKKFEKHQEGLLYASSEGFPADFEDE